MNFAPLQPCAGREQASLISSIFTSPQEMMQWWSWAGKNSDSCVPSETRPKGGKQEAMGKGWRWGTGLQGDTYKTLNFPTTERNEGRCSLLPPYPCRLPQPPGAQDSPFLRESGKSKGSRRGLKQPRGISPEPLPALPISHPRGWKEFCTR